MGCDIHGMIEVKIDGQWTGYCNIAMPRNYGLFSEMADCGRTPDGETPKVNKGLPDDIARITRIMSDHDDGHSHTWLSLEEMGRIEAFYEIKTGNKHAHPAQPWGYLFGNGWHREALIQGVTDVRAVIWFDS